MMVVVTMAIVGLWRLAAPALNWFASHYQTIDSLAVLPFLNATGNPDLEYVADGIVESIINDVSRGTDLKGNRPSFCFSLQRQTSGPKRYWS